MKNSERIIGLFGGGNVGLTTAEIAKALGRDASSVRVSVKLLWEAKALRRRAEMHTWTVANNPAHHVRYRWYLA